MSKEIGYQLIRASQTVLVAATTLVNYLITTPANIEVQISWMIHNQARVDPVFHEGPTVTGAGTNMIMSRLNLRSSIPILTTITHSGTVTDKGTELSRQMIFSTQPQLVGPKETHPDARWILKPSTVYLLEVNRPTSGILSVTFDFIENRI